MSHESENVAEKPSEQSVVHTPGPWMILDLREKGEECITIAMTTSPQALCRIRNKVSGVPLNQEDLANAKLIAAAPDLLAALREIRGELCRRYSPFVVDVDYAYINAAINKATGKVALTLPINGRRQKINHHETADSPLRCMGLLCGD